MDIANLLQTSAEKNYALLLKKLENVDLILKKNAEEVFVAIQNQNMETHQLIFMYVICYLDVQTHFNVFDRFLKTVHNGNQVLFKIEKLNKIAEEYKKFMIKQHIGSKAIKALEVAIAGLKVSNIGFTRLHLYFVETCLASKMYKSALRMIDQPLVHIEIASKIDEVDFHAFQYYSGCIYLGLKRTQEARQCFSMIIQLCKKEIHQVYLDALKKLIILNVGTEKAFTPQLDGFDPIQSQIISNYSSVYNLINKDGKEGYSKFVSKNNKELIEEGNFSLAIQMDAKFLIKELKRLNKVYLRYSVGELQNENKLGDYSKDIIELQRITNKIQRIFKINRKSNCIEFITKEEIDHQSQVLVPLKNLFGLLKGVKQEYENENEKMLLDRLQSFETA